VKRDVNRTLIRIHVRTDICWNGRPSSNSSQERASIHVVHTVKRMCIACSAALIYVSMSAGAMHSSLFLGGIWKSTWRPIKHETDATLSTRQNDGGIMLQTSRDSIRSCEVDHPYLHSICVIQDTMHHVEHSLLSPQYPAALMPTHEAALCGEAIPFYRSGAIHARYVTERFLVDDRYVLSRAQGGLAASCLDIRCYWTPPLSEAARMNLYAWVV